MSETRWNHVSGETISDEAMHQRFEDYYDELRGPVAVGGVGDSAPFEISASRVLRELDPMAYADQFDHFVWQVLSGWDYVETDHDPAERFADGVLEAVEPPLSAEDAAEVRPALTGWFTRWAGTGDPSEG